MNNADWKKDIANYIENYSENEYDEILSRDNRFELFYHLSESRKGILNWYDFEPGTELLEIGGGYGALSSVFCSKCKSVTVTERSVERAAAIRKRLRGHENVTVLVGDLEEPSVRDGLSEDGYDYIVVIGLLELQADPVAYLLKFRRLLKADGKILATVDNPYGAHYLAGGMHPVGNMLPFDSLNGRGRIQFTRKKIIDTVEKAGFATWKLFYPVPDYHFSQVIYSDDYLPQTRLAERIQICSKDTSTLVANEKKILDDAVDNGMFPFVANSFLIECSANEKVSGVNYAAVTLERNKKQSCITKIYADSVVTKEAVHAEGVCNIERIAGNIQDLQAHELDVVPCEVVDGVAKMPFCSAPLLSSVLDAFMEEGQAAFVEVFDKLYENILRSSEQVETKENVLMTEDNKSWSWGPILKKCYFEMIPMNCFYDAGRFVYFDQEFVRDHFPAKYTLYRALRNTYLFNQKAEKCIPLQEMKARYKMEQIWDIFEQTDDDFLREIRKVNNPRSKWTRISVEQIKKNQQLLKNE